jgi:hypothetical protein
VATTDLIGAHERTDQGMSLHDVLAHEASTHVTWRARERFLRELPLNGDIRTAGEQLLSEQTGRWAAIEVAVEYVSPIAPDGSIYLVVASPDGAGRALAVTDGSQAADAHDWMLRDRVSLFGRAATLFGQPGIDLRRAVFEVAA